MSADTLRIVRFAKVAALIAKGHAPVEISRNNSGTLCVYFHRTPALVDDIKCYNSRRLEANAHIMQAVRNALIDVDSGSAPASVSTLVSAVERAVSAN